VSFCAERPVVSFCAERPVVSFCAERPVVSFCVERPVVSFCVERPVVSFPSRASGANDRVYRQDRTVDLNRKDRASLLRRKGYEGLERFLHSSIVIFLVLSDP
jgi:hypothetical protein